MKRIGLMLLALVLLCGCSTTEQAPTLDAMSTMEVPTTEPIPTEPPYEKQVLEGGVWVQTDYSKYIPNEPVEAKYTRLSQEYISELQPRDDYGMLYPFVGNRSFADYLDTLYYGMVDASGRVVVDAVYDNIGLVSRGYLTWYPQGEQTFPMWALRKTEPTDGYAKSTYALASLDGSFVSEHIYSQVTAYDEYVFAYIYNGEDAIVLHVYDKEGNLCLNSENLPFRDRLESYPDAISYGSGLFTVRFKEPSECYIADWEGNLLYGPFEEAECYVDGYALVKKMNGDYAYIDVNGNYLLDMEFTYADSFHGGFAAVEDAKGKQMLLSAEEGIVVSVDADGGYWDGTLFSVWKDDATTWREYAYNTKGELLHEWTSDQYYEFFGSENLMHDYQEGKVINLQTGEEFSLGSEVDYYLGSFEYSYPFTEVPFFYVNYYDEPGMCVLFDESFREILTTTGFINIVEDALTKKRYITAADGTTQIFSMDAESIVTFRFSNCQFYNDTVLCYDDVASYYYDLEGNLLFCYPYDGLGDD